MGTPHDGSMDRAMLHSLNLGKCTKPHDDLGPDFDECPLFDSKKPSYKFCGACGCHVRFHAKPNLDSRDDNVSIALDPKHKIFLSHSGKQKDFVEQLCLDLQRFDRYAFFDKDQYCLPIGEEFPRLIFKAIQQCHVGVVILSDDFFTSKWPMMELAGMVDEAVKRRFNFKIIPVFLYSSLKDICDDSPKLIKWRLLWKKWALENPLRVNVKKWEAALKHLRPINGIKGIEYDKLGEVHFREVIVDAICTAVPPEIKLEVSHIQGRSRICEVIRKKIIEVQQKNKFNGVCIVGLYGMGGIGKTSICKVLYNEFLTEFQTRVCHAELERKTEEELLREVLERLTDINPKLFNGRNIDELRDLLQRGIGKHPIFLALDNMSDNYASIKEAEHYLSQNFKPGSIVMVTARSLGLLMRLRPYLDESDCLEMPELEEEEAKSLFAKSSKIESRNEVDEQLIMRCVGRCRFWKDDDKERYHYHPLALYVLGTQLGFIDREQWGPQLEKINEDIFNPTRKNNHPIFSILRKSFETLCLEDQLLFMDVALFLPGQGRTGLECNYECNVFEWLAMMHGIASVHYVMTRLEMLKTISLLERLGDGVKISIGMHDLWRAFCVAETSNGELGCRRWVYETNKRSELLETSPSGTWRNVKRMTFSDCGSELRSLERANFAHFPNVAVLMLSGKRTVELVLDLSRLKRLKSLEVRCDHLSGLVLQGLPRDLAFLSFRHSNEFLLNHSSVEHLIEQIGRLQKLQCLQLIGYGGSKLPNLAEMVSLRVANLCGCLSADTLTGLSSKLTNLRVLDFRECRHLSSCPGVGDLVSLEELNSSGCESLAKLPNLQKLRNLRRLVVSGCPLLIQLPGLGDLVALEELYAQDIISTKLELPDMCKLTNLQVLHLGYRVLETVAGFDNLISLREVVTDFQKVADLPNLQQLTKLQKLEIRGWGLAGLRGLNNLALLQSLDLRYCVDVDELPDCRGMISLQTLRIEECEFKDVPGLSNVSALESLLILRCRKLERLPDLRGLTRLKLLDVSSCAVLKDWDCTLGQVGKSSCRLDSMRAEERPDCTRLTGSQPLILSPCGFSGVTSIGSYSQLETLKCWNVGVRELPDLSNFPRLQILWLERCENLRRLTCREPMSMLSKLKLISCRSLAALPDLCNFPALPKLKIIECSRIFYLRSSGPLLALAKLNLSLCANLKKLPDLKVFPALKVLKMSECYRLPALRSSVPLLELQELELIYCSSVKALPDLGMFPGLEHLDLEGCVRLTRMNSSMPLTALPKLELKNFRDLKALPDLGMFPALQHLDLEGCSKLTTLNSSMPLAALPKIDLKYCGGLRALPDLEMFPALRQLELYGCSELAILTVSECLTALYALSLENCSGLKALPDLEMFPALQDLLLRGCSGLTTLSTSAALTALYALSLENCSGLGALPDLGMFPALQDLLLRGCSGLATLSTSMALTALYTLSLEDCSGLKALPDLGMFPALEDLLLRGYSGLMTLSANAALTALEKIALEDCSGLKALPDLGMFPALKDLLLMGCSELSTLSTSAALTALRSLRLKNCSGLKDLPDLESFPALQVLTLISCIRLATLRSSVTLSAMERIILQNCIGLESLPDLEMFPALRDLELYKCTKLTMLTSSGPLVALYTLSLGYCSDLKTLPDLGSFPALRDLLISGCNGLTAFSSSVTLIALKEIKLQYCSGLKALPDLEMCPGLQFLELDGCSGLTTLSSSVLLTKSKELKLQNCTGLKALKNLEMFPQLKILDLSGCSRLTALSSSTHLTQLRWLALRNCTGLKALKNLEMFPQLEGLDLSGCSRLTALSSSTHLTQLRWLVLRNCTGLKALKNLEIFRRLNQLDLSGCSGLTALCSFRTFTWLHILDVTGCKSLSQNVLDQIQASYGRDVRGLKSLSQSNPP